MDTKKLTNKEIYEAFPDALADINRNIRLLQREIDEYSNQNNDIYKSALIKGYEWFFGPYIDAFLTPHEMIKKIKYLKGLKSYYQYWQEQIKVAEDNAAGRPIRKIRQEPLDVDRAKQSPILDMYHFGKQRRSGKRVYVCCPFHREKTASMCIYLTSNTFHCFGCHKSGDAISFYMSIHEVDFKTAVRALM